MGILIVLIIIGIIFYVCLHRSADKAEERFNNRPYVISDPAKDLFTNEKFAIVGLLAFIQGASPQSAYDEEANRIAQSTISSLGLPHKDVEKYLTHSLGQNPDRLIDRMIDSLKEIRDKQYIKGLYDKCLRIARISGENDAIEMTRQIFKEIGI